jgi:integrase
VSTRLGIGERGEVFFPQERPGGVLVMVYFRDHGGKRRRAKAWGPSRAAARRSVKAAVDVALMAGGGTFRPSTTFAVAAEVWLAAFEEKVARGSRSPTTLDVYRSTLRAHVLPGVGALRLSEFTPGRFDRFLSEVHVQHGFATAKLCRTVLSGVCGLLVRRDALRHNPIRDVARLERGHARATKRTLSRQDVVSWLRTLDGSELARRKDLPDLVRLLLATGMRLGEALALTWDDVDLDRGVVLVEWTLVRATGKGLIRKSTKAASSDRTLLLPTWCVSMLRRRLAAAAGLGPVFPSATGSWRDRNNVCKDLREVRAGTSFDWFVTHVARRSVATLLDGEGLSARAIADQLGHARVSMTQDVYMGRRLPAPAVARSLDALLCGCDDDALVPRRVPLGPSAASSAPRGDQENAS